jgi:hypothetical protein
MQRASLADNTIIDRAKTAIRLKQYNCLMAYSDYSVLNTEAKLYPLLQVANKHRHK